MSQGRTPLISVWSYLLLRTITNCVADPAEVDQKHRTGQQPGAHEVGSCVKGLTKQSASSRNQETPGTLGAARPLGAGQKRRAQVSFD
jgi:hypothetical protein